MIIRYTARQIKEYTVTVLDLIGKVIIDTVIYG